MALAQYLPVAAVVAVPLLYTLNHERNWLTTWPRALIVWPSLLLFGLAGTVLLGRQVPALPRENYLALFFWIPLVQAIVTVAVAATFRLITRRELVPIDVARFGRRDDGKRYWPDVFVWIILMFGVPGLGSVAAVMADIEFPRR